MKTFRKVDDLCLQTQAQEKEIQVLLKIQQREQQKIQPQEGILLQDKQISQGREPNRKK